MIKQHVGMCTPDEVETKHSLDATTEAEAGAVQHSTETGRTDLLVTLRRTLAALRAWDPSG